MMFTLALLSKTAHAFDMPPEAMVNPDHAWNQWAWTPGDWIMALVVGLACIALMTAVINFFRDQPKHDPSTS